jgi:hypothetical protein
MRPRRLASKEDNIELGGQRAPPTRLVVHLLDRREDGGGRAVDEDVELAALLDREVDQPLHLIRFGQVAGVQADEVDALFFRGGEGGERSIGLMSQPTTRAPWWAIIRAQP